VQIKPQIFGVLLTGVELFKFVFIFTSLINSLIQSFSGGGGAGDVIPTLYGDYLA
jgi:hypothetical protein